MMKGLCVGEEKKVEEKEEVINRKREEEIQGIPVPVRGSAKLQLGMCTSTGELGWASGEAGKTGPGLRQRAISPPCFAF